jgi:hypothetical protein
MCALPCCWLMAYLNRGLLASSGVAQIFVDPATLAAATNSQYYLANRLQRQRGSGKGCAVPALEPELSISSAKE